MSFLLKNEISKQLTEFFKLPLVTGIFGLALKTENIVPVLKKDWRLDYSNYHPISLLLNIEKILEKLMYKRLYTFLHNKNVIYNLLLDSRNYSASHALINITEDIEEALD